MVIHFENASEARRETKNNAYEGFVYVVGGGGYLRELAWLEIMCGKLQVYKTHPKALLVAYPAVMCSRRLGGFT